MLTKKKTYIEILRIIGAALVLFNHSATYPYYLNAEVGSMGYVVSLCASVFCKLAVPLFYMIAGAVLFPKEESIAELYRHRVFKFLLTMGSFSVVQYLYQVWNGSETSVVEFVKIVYKSRITSSYWFLYGYLAVLMLLPFLRRMTRNMSQTEFRYLFILKVIFGAVLPMFELHFSSSINLELQLLSDNIFYMLMGHYVANKLDSKELKHQNALLLTIASISGIILSSVMTYYEFCLKGSYTEIFMNCLTCVTAVWIFYAVRLLFEYKDISSRNRKVVEYIGSCTFAIYLLGNIITDCLAVIEEWLILYTGNGIAAILFVILRMGIGIMIASILKLIPGVRKLI